MSPAARDTSASSAPPPPEAPGAVTFNSLATWRSLTVVLGRRGPEMLHAAARYRSAAHSRFGRFPVLG